jgi:uncharacterized membrane protein YeaQ/YmgE (transglycosylase-associated protein family)
MVDLHISFTNLLVWVVVGGVAGWLASLVVRGNGLGLLGDIVVGVLGALFGGLVLSRLLPTVYNYTGGFTGFNLGSLLVAFIGAVLLLLVVRVFTSRHTPSSTR